MDVSPPVRVYIVKVSAKGEVAWDVVSLLPIVMILTIYVQSIMHPGLPIS